MNNKNYINRLIISSLGLGACLFYAISLISFDILDWPNPDVIRSTPIANLCGPIGAWMAYYSKYYLGPATFPILLAVTVWLVLFCMNKKMEQLILRAIGVLLVGAAISAADWLINPGNATSLTTGNGGILGISLGHFLLTSTARFGAFLILTATILVGLLLAADNLLLMLPRFLGYAAEQMRQAGPILSTVTEKTGQITDKARQKAEKSRFAFFKSSSAVSELPPELDEVDDSDLSLRQPEDNLHDSQTFHELDQEENEPIEEDEPQSADLHTQSDDEIRITQPPQSNDTLNETTVSALAKLVSQRKRTSIKKEEEAPDYSGYIYPPASLLDPPSPSSSEIIKKSVRRRAAMLQQTLKDFNLDTEVVSAETGPVITMFELKLAPGIKVSRISSLSNDLARSLGAPAVRVVAPLPGRHTIGIEAPNSQKETVRIKDLLRLAGDQPGRMQIPLFLGKDASGQPLIEDLTRMPHCLIAGTTGSGKSVCINSIITSILLTQRPDMVKLILIDPKMVEMNAFTNISHLMCPIVTEMARAEQMLKWLTEKMDERYALLAEALVRNIAGYNKLTEDELMERFKPTNEVERMKIPMKLPYIVVVIDELADLMMTSAKEVESYIVRLAQKSRAVGIHLVLATQRPQATVVTGLIKSNMPCRISFRVASRMDSRIVLDSNGAETLLGQGDMLFLKPGTCDLLRTQGTFLSDNEINRIVKHIKEVSQPSFHPELMQLNTIESSDEPRDELFDEAVKIILTSRRGSVSLLQRRLTIGYSRASRLIDQMAAAGIVGEYKGSQARDVTMTLEEYQAIRRQMNQDAVNGYSDMQDNEDFASPDDDSMTDDMADFSPDENLDNTSVAQSTINPQAAERTKDIPPITPHIPAVDDDDSFIPSARTDITLDPESDSLEKEDSLDSDASSQSDPQTSSVQLNQLQIEEDPDDEYQCNAEELESDDDFEEVLEEDQEDYEIEYDQEDEDADDLIEEEEDEEEVEEDEDENNIDEDDQYEYDEDEVVQYEYIDEDEEDPDEDKEN